MSRKSLPLHDNSCDSRQIEKASGRSTHYRQLVYRTIQRFAVVYPEGLTDREVMYELGVIDPNLIRPEITRLKAAGMLRETGKTRCAITGRQVRRVTVTERPYASGEKLQSKPAAWRPDAILSAVLDVLNQALDKDPEAIRQLLNLRVPCANAMADHPSLVVDTCDSLTGETRTLDVLGVVNGICRHLTGGRVAVMLDAQPDRQIIRKFVKFDAS